MTKFNFLKHVQYFDSHSSNWKKEKEKKERKKYSVYNFSENLQHHDIF